MGLFKHAEENTILREGKRAQRKLTLAKKKGILPKNSRELYRAMKKAGLDI